MIKTAVLLPAGARVQPEEILVNDYKNIQDIVGGCFDCVRYDGEGFNGEPVVLCGYVHDEGLLLGMETNYLASMLFGRMIVGPCVVTYALSPSGTYDGDDYEMPAELIGFLTNDLLVATATTYNQAALMAVASEQMVASGALTEEDVELMADEMEAITRGEQEELSVEADMIMLMLRTYLEDMEKELESSIKDAAKKIAREYLSRNEKKEDDDDQGK
jgi:hypothetical protein